MTVWWPYHQGFSLVSFLFQTSHLVSWSVRPIPSLCCCYCGLKNTQCSCKWLQKSLKWCQASSFSAGVEGGKMMIPVLEFSWGKFSKPHMLTLKIFMVEINLQIIWFSWNQTLCDFPQFLCLSTLVSHYNVKDIIWFVAYWLPSHAFPSWPQAVLSSLLPPVWGSLQQCLRETVCGFVYCKPSSQPRPQ